MHEARASAERWQEVWPPSFEDYQENNKSWFFAQPEFIDRLNADLRKAGVGLP